MTAPLSTVTSSRSPSMSRYFSPMAAPSSWVLARICSSVRSTDFTSPLYCSPHA
ncbi:Uncharacterised protein [Mycobacteroides abscessus subsp. abscessus]|nr:Uncharacterised protein [Mycobacteroides abscessus subsp. abscessus]